jgi:hypothetical protein
MDFGFDHPGPSGLDINDLLCLIFIQGCFAVYAVSRIVKEKCWKYVGVEVALLFLTLLGIIVGDL